MLCGALPPLSLCAGSLPAYALMHPVDALRRSAAAFALCCLLFHFVRFIGLSLFDALASFISFLAYVSHLPAFMLAYYFRLSACAGL